MFKDFVLEVYNFINKVKLTKYFFNLFVGLSYGLLLIWDYILKMEGYNPNSGGGPPSYGGGPSGDPGGGNFNYLQNAGNNTDTNDLDDDPDEYYNSVNDFPNRSVSNEEVIQQSSN
jgi:hypothetical protein